MSTESVATVTGTKGRRISVVRRLLSFSQAHRKSLWLGMLSLVFAAVGELLIPLVVQRTVDDVLLARYIAVDPVQAQTLPANEIERVRSGQETSYVPETLYRQYLRIEGSTAPLTLLYTSPLEGLASETLDQLSELGGRVDGQFLVIEETELSQLSTETIEALRSKDSDDLLIAVFILLGLSSIVFVGTYIQVYYMAKTGQGVMGDLRQTILKHLMGQRLRSLHSEPVGKLVTRVTSDVETINELFTTVLSSLLKDVIHLVGASALLFIVSPQLAWVAMGATVPVFILAVLFSNQARRAYRQVRTKVSQLNTYISEHVSGVAVIQSYFKQGARSARFDGINEELKNANIGEMRVFAIFRPLVDLFLSIATALVLYYGTDLFTGGAVTLGVLIAFINLLQRLYQPIMDISEKFNLLQSAVAGGEKIFSTLDRDDPEPSTCCEGEGVDLMAADVRGEIAFDNVHFAYEPSNPVLKGLSFAAEPGQKVAVVGYTGSGKTTILNLLTRLWDHDSGLITLDSVEINEIPSDQLRKTIQVIQQDSVFFQTTIRENILMGQKLSDEQLNDIVKRVQLDDFIARQKDGLDTVLEEGASSLSSGQKQLLSFARILAQDPPVVAMDEATAHVDSLTESMVIKAMEELLKGRTSIVIAHRLSTIQDADKILVLNGGVLEEAGTHEELLEIDGLYKNLYELQQS